MTIAEVGGRTMHGALRIGDAVMELGEPEDRAGIPTNGMFLFVEDVDAVYARALEAGATSYRPPEDLPYGMRSAVVEGPGWIFVVAGTVDSVSDRDLRTAVCIEPA